MGPSGKWIEGICRDGSVEDAARRSLEARLTAANHWLPLAAHLAGQDAEHVHRLRVGTRRAVAAIRLYRDWLRRKPARWMKKRLKKIRRAAGEARDFDVLATRLEHDYGTRAGPVLAVIAERRAAVQAAIIDIAERCRRRDRFVRKTAQLLAGIRSPEEHRSQPITFREWAAKQLTDVSACFFAALPNETADTTILHQFRIRTKALRYTIELVAPAFGPELRGEHYPVVEELQERLGKIQDYVTASDRLRNWADDASNAPVQELLRELAVEETVHLDEEVRELRGWWTAERVEALRRGLMPQSATEAATPTPQAAHQM
ncbi:MAG: CHAD domain-containing protein [Pirellulales bacterium]